MNYFLQVQTQTYARAAEGFTKIIFQKLFFFCHVNTRLRKEAFSFHMSAQQRHKNGMKRLKCCLEQKTWIRNLKEVRKERFEDKSFHDVTDR